MSTGSVFDPLLQDVHARISVVESRHTNMNLNLDRQSKKGLRIGGASGGFTDRQRSIYSLAKCGVDVIVGDWMSECTV